MNNKIFFLSSEIAPFSETYYVSQFTKRFCSYMHLQPDTDIRLNQPKFGYISERKYILREVIRLKDMFIDLQQGNEKKKVKGIFGKASEDEVKELREEGIEAEVIPWLEDKNN